MRFLEIVPLVFVMIGGPQILVPIFLATTESWRRNSAAYVVGAALSITLVVTVTYVFGGGTVGPGGSNATLSAIVLVALLFAMVHTYRTRNESEPPRWMGKLGAATPRFSFRLGFLLLGFFPTDVLTSVAVGSYLATTGAPLTHAVPFVLLTLLALAVPSLVLVAFGERAEAFLPTARDWIDQNSWVINELVIVFFVVLSLNNLLG